MSVPHSFIEAKDENSTSIDVTITSMDEKAFSGTYYMFVFDVISNLG